MHGREVVLLDEFEETALAGATRSDLCVEVALALVSDAHVGEQQLDDVAVELPVAVDQHGWNANALLVDLGRLDVEGAGHHAAHVRPVPGRRNVADDLLLEEDWLDQTDILQVRSTHVR